MIALKTDTKPLTQIGSADITPESVNTGALCVLKFVMYASHVLYTVPLLFADASARLVQGVFAAPC